MSETLKTKLKSYRFIIFSITVLFVTGFFFLCRWCPGLIPLSGCVTAVIGLAVVLIGGKTITDIKGKKQ